MSVTRETVFLLLYPGGRPLPDTPTSLEQADRVRRALDAAYKAGGDDAEIEHLLSETHKMRQKPGNDTVLLVLFQEGKQAFAGGAAKVIEGGALRVAEANNGVTIYAPSQWRFFTTVTQQQYDEMQKEKA